MLNDYESNQVEETEDEIHITGEDFDQVLFKHKIRRKDSRTLLLDGGC